MLALFTATWFCSEGNNTSNAECLKSYLNFIDEAFYLSLNFVKFCLPFVFVTFLSQLSARFNTLQPLGESGKEKSTPIDI